MAVVVPAPLGRSGVEAVPLARAVPRASFREAVFQAGEPGEGLEGGGSGIKARRHAVLQRRVRGIGVVDVVRLGGKTSDPVRRVERGIARQRDDAAVAHVHGHDRTTDALPCTDNAVTRRDKARERLVGGVLDRALDRQVHVRPAGRLGLAHHVHDVALRIDGDDTLPVVAREQVVVRALDARFAHVVGQLDIAVGRRIGNLALTRRTRVAQGMGAQGAEGVIAHGARLHRHTREGVGVLGDEGNVAQADIARHDALALRARRGRLDALAHDCLGNAEDGRKPGDDVVVVDHVRIGEDGLARTVLHERDAVGVVDVAARCGRRHRGIEVARGLARVILV